MFFLLSKDEERLIHLGKIKSDHLKGVLWLFYGCHCKKSKGVKEEKIKTNKTPQKQQVWYSCYSFTVLFLHMLEEQNRDIVPCY